MGLGLSSEQQGMAKASVGQSNRAHLKLQHDLSFVPFSALWGFFFPLTPVTSEYSFPWLCQPGVRCHPGLGRASLGLCVGGNAVLALSSKEGSERYLGYPGHQGIAGQSSAKGSACPLESWSLWFLGPFSSHKYSAPGRYHEKGVWMFTSSSGAKPMPEWSCP